jgi:hypothetical protein
VTRSALQKFIVAREAVRAAEKAEEAAFRKAFLLDTLIEWKHGPHYQSGRVVSLGYGTRLLAQNCNTGKTVWVEGYKIVEAYT